MSGSGITSGFGRLYLQMSKLDDPSRSSDGDPLIRRLARTPRAVPFAGTARYAVIRCLGEGGFGVVYEVEDRQLGRNLALKTLKPQRAGMFADIRRLKSEFRSVADLVHPNLVGLHELSTEDGRWFFTMDLVRGYDFLEHVCGDTALAFTHTAEEERAPAVRRHDTSGILSETRLRSSLRQLVAGVRALHGAGIIHRDLKPSNVLVESDGRVVILDFGLAGVASSVEADASIRLAGTPSYMAPEQADDAPLTPAADWYAVGVMLYEALSGQLPFDDQSGPRLVQKWTRDPVPPSAHRRVPADLERLCLALLRRKPEERPDAAAIVAMIGEGPPPPADPLRSEKQPAFVGRARELDALRAAHAAVLAGRPKIVRIEGAPGVGKSALVRRFLHEVAAGATVLAGRCHEREWVPYKALDGVVDALVRYLRALPRNEASGLLPRDVHLIAQQFPALEAIPAIRDVPKRQVSPIDPAEIRQRAFAAFRELVGRVADKQPLVMVIDDLQWGDADSARLLAHLVAPPDRPALLLLLVHRRDEVELAPALRETLRGVAAAGAACDEVLLEPLRREDAEHLAAKLLGDVEAASQVARTIAERGEGHPLFMEELARALLGDPNARIAPTLIDILWQRVARLSDHARALLETVAVAGQPVPRALCFDAAGVGGAGVDAVRALRAEQLIVTADSGVINVFHDRVRDAVLGHLGLGARRTRHLALARSLERWPDPDLADLARHYDAAEVPEQAAHYAERAADLAMKTLAFDRAAALYRMALERGGEAAHGLHEKLGDALTHAGSDADAGEAYLAASAHAHGEQAVRLTARAAEQLLAVGRFDAGEEAIRCALAAVGESVPKTSTRSLMEGIRHLIWMRLGSFRFRERVAATIAPEHLLRLDVLAFASYGMMNADFMRAFGMVMRFARMALKTGEPRRAALALIHASAGLSGSSRPPLIDDLLDRAEAIAERVGDPNLRAFAVRARATSCFMYGDLPAARRLCEVGDALISQQCRGMGIDQRFLRTMVAMIDVTLGNVESARRVAVSELRAAVERRDPVAERGSCICGLVQVNLAADEPEVARRFLERASMEDRCANVLFGVAASAAVAMYVGRPRDAVDQWRARWPQIKREGMLIPPAFRIMTVASLVNALLQCPGGRAYIREAARLTRSIRGYRFPVAVATWSALRACLAAHEGDLDGAAVLLLEAARRFEEASWFPDASACRYRHAQIAGGSKRERLLAAAEESLRARGIVCPERWVTMRLPPLATGMLKAG